MITYKELMERAFSPAGQVARAKMRQQGDFNAARKAYDKSKASNPDPKALPPGKQGGSLSPSKGGALAHRPADKGRDMVNQKSGALATIPKPGSLANTPKEKGGALVAPFKPKADKKPLPYRYGNPKPKDKKPGRNYGKMAKDIGKAGLGLAGDIGKGIMKAKTTGKGQPMSRGGGIEPPKRGVYNG